MEFYKQTSVPTDLKKGYTIAVEVSSPRHLFSAHLIVGFTIEFKKLY